jgi:hypothetical protein
MIFMTTRQLLDDIRDHHAELGELFKRRARIAASPGTRLMLRFLADEQGRLSRQILRFEQDGRRSTLGTWFGFAPPRPRHAGAAEVKSQMSPAELVEVALEHHGALVSYCKQLAREAAVAPVRELFEDLSELEAHEVRYIAAAEAQFRLER